MKKCPKCGSIFILMFDSDNDYCEDCLEWFPAVEDIEEEEEGIKSIEWYESQVQELKDIRKIYFKRYMDTENQDDAYFPDLIEEKLDELEKLRKKGTNQ